MAAASPLTQPSFTWLHGLLWPGTETDPHRPEYAVISRGDRPRLVIPLESRSAVAAVLSRDSADVSTGQGLMRRGAAFAARLGALQPFLRTRFRPATPDDGPPIETYLAEALGLSSVLLAATIGPPRPNRKPVLQLLTADGRTIGFAKVGWNGLTRGLVEAETAILTELAATDTARIRPPELLHHGRWRDLEISIVSALDPPGGAMRRDPTADEIVELASLGPRSAGPLASSTYWASLAGRLADLDEPHAGRYRRVFDAIAARAGDVRVEFGRWHGDWTPWNMAPLSDSLLVWDWERSATDIPVLLDSFHYSFQRAWLRRGESPQRAIVTATNEVAPHASAFGLDAAIAQTLAPVYLLELSLRYAANAGAGTDELRSERHAAVEAALESLIARAT